MNQLLFKDATPSVRKLVSLTKAFSKYFTDRGYCLMPKVDITCGKDESVRFIGAPISVLKPYFISDKVPESGVIMVQNCIRTRNLKTLFELDTCPNWGSFFTGMCVLVKYNRLEKLCSETVDFLTQVLRISTNEIMIKISKRDKDLVAAISKCAPKDKIMFDTERSDYYRHKYGLDNIRGRNFNIALRNARDGHYEDIGNIIVIEDKAGKQQYGVELAIGDSTIMKQLLGLSHVLDNYGINLRHIENDNLRVRMIDALITCLILFGEGLRPKGSGARARILKSYTKALALYKMIASITDEELQKLLTDIESKHLPIDNRGACRTLVSYVKKYSEDFSNILLSKEDKKIVAILRNRMI